MQLDHLDFHLDRLDFRLENKENSEQIYPILKFNLLIRKLYCRNICLHVLSSFITIKSTPLNGKANFLDIQLGDSETYRPVSGIENINNANM